jgi:hypothetical protein
MPQIIQQVQEGKGLPRTEAIFPYQVPKDNR